MEASNCEEKGAVLVKGESCFTSSDISASAKKLYLSIQLRIWFSDTGVFKSREKLWIYTYLVAGSIYSTRVFN